MGTLVWTEREIRVDLPARRALVDDVHERIENSSKNRENDQRREDAGGVELARRRGHEIADPAVAGDQLTDDRADQRVGDRDPDAGERGAQRVRHDDLEEDVT